MYKQDGSLPNRPAASEAFCRFCAVIHDTLESALRKQLAAVKVLLRHLHG